MEVEQLKINKETLKYNIDKLVRVFIEKNNVGISKLEVVFTESSTLNESSVCMVDDVIIELKI